MNPIIQEITIKAPADRIFEPLTIPDETPEMVVGRQRDFRDHARGI